MKNAIIKIFFFIFLLLNFSACEKKVEKPKDLLEEIKEKQVFVVGTNNNSKPFAYTDENNKKLTGFDAELIKLLAEDIFGSSTIVKFEKVTPENRIIKGRVF